ncbi:MAG: hypothetical protein COA50_07930 [Flavobacteriaceae bacterium]|nr:MAG: hypothetical protein COA50_07930 [Flavobacteriaceae bacterium]
MKNILFLFILIGCTSGKKKLDIISDCVKNEENEFLAQGLDDFEVNLEIKYSGLSQEQQYIHFLKDFSDHKIPTSFYIRPESKVFRDNIKLVEIWRKVALDGSESSKKPMLVILTKEFQSCLMNKTQNKGIKGFLGFRNRVSSHSLALSVKYIYDNISEKDLENEVNRLVISLALYYEFGINLEN